VVHLRALGERGLIDMEADENGEIAISLNRAGGFPVVRLQLSATEGLQPLLWG
jgi:hypothetical protein